MEARSPRGPIIKGEWASGLNACRLRGVWCASSVRQPINNDPTYFGGGRARLGRGGRSAERATGAERAPPDHTGST